MRPSGEIAGIPSGSWLPGGAVISNCTRGPAVVGISHSHVLKPTATSAAATQPGHARDRAGTEALAVDASEAFEFSESMAMRASPIACSRCRRSLVKQRESSIRIRCGTAAGRSAQSGSLVITKASVSLTPSPANARRPVSIS